MAIPGCNDGNFMRGGNGMYPDARDSDGDISSLRGCWDTTIMKPYQNDDIIMSNDDNKCS